ncbi:MAG: hypothetical protein U1F43_25805 [Myxococcota bacterium]
MTIVLRRFLLALTSSALAATAARADAPLPCGDPGWHGGAVPAGLEAMAWRGDAFVASDGRRALLLAPDGAVRAEVALPDGVSASSVAAVGAAGARGFWVVGGGASPRTMWFGRVAESERGLRVAASASVEVEVGGEIHDAEGDGRGGLIAVGLHNPVVSKVTHAWIVGLDGDGTKRFERRLGTGYSIFTDLFRSPTSPREWVAIGAAKPDGYVPLTVRFDDGGKVVDQIMGLANETHLDVGAWQQSTYTPSYAIASGGGLTFIGTGPSGTQQVVWLERVDRALVRQRLLPLALGREAAAVSRPIAIAGGIAFVALTGPLDGDEHRDVLVRLGDDAKARLTPLDLDLPGRGDDASTPLASDGERVALLQIRSTPEPGWRCVWR